MQKKQNEREMCGLLEKPLPLSKNTHGEKRPEHLHKRFKMMKERLYEGTFLLSALVLHIQDYAPEQEFQVVVIYSASEDNIFK
jgi:hypothetical protein